MGNEKSVEHLVSSCLAVPLRDPVANVANMRVAQSHEQNQCTRDIEIPTTSHDRSYLPLVFCRVIAQTFEYCPSTGNPEMHVCLARKNLTSCSQDLTCTQRLPFFLQTRSRYRQRLAKGIKNSKNQKYFEIARNVTWDYPVKLTCVIWTLTILLLLTLLIGIVTFIDVSYKARK